MKKSQFPSQMHCGACLSAQCLEAAGRVAAARCVTVGLLSWSLAAQRSHVQPTQGRQNHALLSSCVFQHIYLSINQTWMLGQSPIFHSSILWNLSWLQVSGTVVLHLIWMTGPAKAILSPDTLQGHWFCTGLERTVSPTESQIPLARAVFLLCVTSNQHSTILTAARKADNIFFQGTKI